MNEQELENWRKAGQIAKEVSDYAKNLIQDGVSLLKIADLIELKISELGGKPAFPVNLSINETAAHYSPFSNDPTIAEGLIKVDFGVEYNGCLSDTAFSIDLTAEKEYSELIKSTELALEEALKTIKPGVSVSEVGKAIEEKIKEHGFRPVKNLSGHEMKKWNLHAGLTIPNYNSKVPSKLKEGMVLAIEPFATTGKGMVKDGNPSGIYRMISRKAISNEDTKKIIDYIEKNYSTLPFTSRWLVDVFGDNVISHLNMLERLGMLHQFAQLKEISDQPVAQAEHTIVITAEGCEILTN